MKKVITIVFLFVFAFNVFAQDYCSTPAKTNMKNVDKLMARQKRTANSNYILEVYFHVIRTSSGTGGVSTSNVQSALDILNNDFNSHGIFFCWNGTIDYINNSSYYNNAPDTCVFYVNSHTDGIDIYIYPSDNPYNEGMAHGIGMSSEFYVSGNIDGTPTCMTHIISHEMGHVLNLWHTYHGTFNEGDPTDPNYDANQCKELVNGSNSSTCGDYVEDTPADPYTGMVDPNDCTYYGNARDANNQLYTPDLTLIMTKALPSCMSHFSTKQGERMRDAIANFQQLINAQRTIYFSGPNSTYYICSSSTATFTICNLPSSFTVNWYFTDGFGPAAPTLQTSNNTCTINNNLSSSYMGILHADIYYQGNLMKSLQQQVVVYAGFYATYSINHGVSQQLTTSNSVIWVNYGDLVEIKSPNLVAKNVSYSIVTPYLWHYDDYTFSGDLDVGFPSSAGHLPVVISVQNNTNYSNCDTSHQILLMPTSVLPQPQLNATGGNGTINVELITEMNEEALKLLQDLPISIQIDDAPTWTLEVIDAKKGDKILTKEITGTSTSVALPGKSTGIFLVRATIGEKTLSEKVIVK